MDSHFKATGGFAKWARLVATLMMVLGFAVVSSPAPAVEARSQPRMDAGIIRVLVTTYQHGNPLEGILVNADVNTTSAQPTAQYTAKTDAHGLATLQVPAGVYHVSTHVVSLLDPYEPWTQDVKVGAGTFNKVSARLLISAEMYPLKFAAADSISILGVGKASVRIYDNSNQTIAQGLTDGTGIFLTKAPKGIFRATVSHPKYEVHTDYLQISSKVGNSNIVALAPLDNPRMGDMQIHVYDGSGSTITPIKGASVTLYGANKVKLDQGMTDETGTYYTCLPEGKYWVEITAPNFTSYSGVHTITAKTLTEYKVILQHPVSH
jgi:hypothetical protein